MKDDFGRFNSTYWRSLRRRYPARVARVVMFCDGIAWAFVLEHLKRYLR